MSLDLKTVFKNLRKFATILVIIAEAGDKVVTLYEEQPTEAHN